MKYLPQLSNGRLTPVLDTKFTILRYIKQISVLSLCIGLSACVNTTFKGHLGTEVQVQKLNKVAAIVVASEAISQQTTQTLKKKLLKYDVEVIHAWDIAPPTRTYSEGEILALFYEKGIKYLLTLDLSNGTSTTAVTGFYAQQFGKQVMAAPIHGCHRSTPIVATLFSTSPGITLWKGFGETNAGGCFYMKDSSTINSALNSIVTGLREAGFLKVED